MNETLDIYVEPTPNPNALKFIVNDIVKSEGKTSYANPEETQDNPMAQELFKLRGVDQIHFFQNVITVSKFSFESWDELEPQVLETIRREMPKHDPGFKEHNPEKERRANLSPELQKIEEVLDKRIRPGLQGDGGDLQCIDFKDNVLIVRYEGACGTCPSSTAGTLQAIRGILQEEYHPEIEVYIAPDEAYDDSLAPSY